MSRTETIHFKQNNVVSTNEYNCQCGHRFKRKVKDWFTMSPFNTKTFEESTAVCLARIKNTIKKCPKCKMDVFPASYVKPVK